METRRDERIGQLLQALKRSDKLHLKEAATLLGVSEMTIRRDLNHKSAPVVLLGGYIVLEPRSASHYLLSDQKISSGGRKTPSRSVGCGPGTSPSDGIY
ncbi:DNA-binding transcriptional repressor DeoR [Salmonella enterica subsp. enterica serovar Enteritidis str. 50-5646]|nr:DNA-binding transcriptional repressor DeoR [Salmonella enterica subsp. enterica serovar Enteritidis str. 50-5646]